MYIYNPSKEVLSYVSKKIVLHFFFMECKKFSLVFRLLHETKFGVLPRFLAKMFSCFLRTLFYLPDDG